MASRSYLQQYPLFSRINGNFPRNGHPAQETIYATLNYGYGILYSMVERGCIPSGLDPCIDILYTDDYNNLSFVFDLIEIFRIRESLTTHTSVSQISGYQFELRE